MDTRCLLVKMRLATIIMAFSLVHAGCASATGTAVSAPMVTKPVVKTDSENQISVTGTVRYLPIEGGFWGIVSDDGNNYDPMALDPAFQKEGLRVRFEAIPEKDMMSIHMWGALVKITRIEAL